MNEPNADGAVEPQNGDGQQPATPPEPLRNADEDDRGKLIASLQEKAATVNEAKARAAAAEARAAVLEDALRRAQSPAANASDSQNDDEDIAAAAAEYPVVGKILKKFDALQNELRATQRETANALAIERIKDEEKKKRVGALFNDNRHRFGDVEVAKAFVENEEKGAEIERLRQERETLRKALEANKRPTDVVATHVREVGAAEHKDTMTQAQWNEEMAELSRRRDAGDMEANKALLRKQQQRAAGKLSVRD